MNEMCIRDRKKEWFSCVGDGIQECRNTWEHKKWNITDFTEFELAITIDRPELYYDFLQKDWTRFCHDYWKNNFLEHHTLSQKRVTRIYIGNQFCHNLFPKKKLLFQVLEKALENNLAVTLAFSYIRNHLLEEIDELLQELEVWCQSREKEAGKDQEEIIVNDWAMPILLQGKPHLKPVLGVLLNKRRKEMCIRDRIRSVHLLYRPCEDDSSVSKFLSAKQIINEFAKYCEE